MRDWRDRGVGSITHGLLHNTMYRGWAAGKMERYPNRDSILSEWLGRNGYYFDKHGYMPPDHARRFCDVLSQDGKQALRRQMRELSGSIKPVVIDGYDLTFERRLVEFISRQINFCMMLGWYEGVDVVSPVFQPALWTWYALSHPRHRDRDWAICEVYLKLDHPAARLPDANTGRPIAHLPVPWRDRVRNQFWYPAFRTTYKRLFHTPQPEEGGLRWGTRFREARILAALEEGVGFLHDNPMFDRAKVRAVLEAYRAGENQLVDPICAVAAIGQWERLLSRPESQTEHVRMFDAKKPQAAARNNIGPEAQLYSSRDSAGF